MRHALLSAVIATLSVSPLVTCMPVKRVDVIDDSIVLNYALTLEHLENAFYSGALAKFDDADFKRAGLPSFARGRFEQIAAHEQAHVKLLAGALGSKATSPCTYKFPYTDVRSFVAFSQLLEGVGVSAYIGAARSIANKDYLTVATSILSTEARHASWVAAAVNKFSGWSGAFDVPLDFNQVYSLAAGSIVSCPSSNPTLPVHAFPTLTLTKSKDTFMTVKHKSNTAPTYIAFLTGFDKIFVPIQDGEVVVPQNLSGQVYAVATNSGNNASDDSILAGPAVLQFERDFSGHLIG